MLVRVNFAMLRLWRAPRVPLARGFAALPVPAAEGGVAAKRKQKQYYATILEKYPRQVKGVFSDEALNRTVAFLADRGISRTKAMQAVANFVPLVTYSTELLESKISWLEELGLSHDKINVAILRNPSMLGHTTERYMTLVNWFLAHGVPEAKLPFLFIIGPSLLSLSSNTLDSKLDFFREIGLTDEQLTGILKRAPQVLCYSTESMNSKLDYMVQLGIPRERLPQLLPNAPDILGLRMSRIQETFDALDEMFGDGAGSQAIERHFRLLSYNVEGLRRAFDYLVSVVGLTPDRLQSCTRYLSRSRDDILRPRFEFLKGQGVDPATRTTWILLSDRVFGETYPGYEAYLAEYKAHQK